MPADLDRIDKKNGWTLGSCFTAKMRELSLEGFRRRGRNEGLLPCRCSRLFADQSGFRKRTPLECFAAVPVDKLDGAFTHARIFAVAAPLARGWQ